MSLSREKERLIGRLKVPRLRRKEGLFLVEGIRSAREFLGATLPLPIRFAVVSSRLEELAGGSQLAAALEKAPFPVLSVDDPDLSGLSDTESPQGILMVVQEPDVPSPETFLGEGGSPPRVLVLDGVQDPGNVGTLLRGARAFGLDGVLALDGTADPWSARAVRAGAGAMAHIPLLRQPVSQALSWLEDFKIQVLVADAGGTDVRSVSPPAGWALVVGNEGGGTRPLIRAAASRLVSVPMAQGVDSLNVAVAGSILLFALSAGRLQVRTRKSPEEGRTG